MGTQDRNSFNVSNFLLEPPNLQERFFSNDHNNINLAYSKANERQRIEKLGHRLHVYGPTDAISDGMTKELDEIEQSIRAGAKVPDDWQPTYVERPNYRPNYRPQDQAKEKAHEDFVDPKRENFTALEAEERPNESNYIPAGGKLEGVASPALISVFTEVARDVYSQVLRDSGFRVFGIDSINHGTIEDEAVDQEFEEPVDQGSSSKGPQEAQGGSEKRKRKTSAIQHSGAHDIDDQEQEEQSDDEKQKRPRREATATSSSTGCIDFKLACPYYKHDRHSCPTTLKKSEKATWPNNNRLKQHIYRKHRLPLFCPKCNTTFDSADALSAHPPHCLPCGAPRPQGFDENQRKQLESKKRQPSNSEVDKWKRTYGILFPGEDIPEPFHEPQDEEHYQRLEHFNEFILSDLPEKLCQRTFSRYGSLSADIKRTLKGFYEDTLTDLMSGALQTWKAQGFAENVGDATSTKFAFAPTFELESMTANGMDPIPIIDHALNNAFPPFYVPATSMNASSMNPQFNSIPSIQRESSASQPTESRASDFQLEPLPTERLDIITSPQSAREGTIDIDVMKQTEEDGGNQNMVMMEPDGTLFELNDWLLPDKI